MNALLRLLFFSFHSDEKLPKELDFCNEGRNAEKSAAHIYKTGISCVVPKVHWPFTTSRVLCMDFEEGFRCNDVQKLEKSGLKKRWGLLTVYD